MRVTFQPGLIEWRREMAQMINEDEANHLHIFFQSQHLIMLGPTIGGANRKLTEENEKAKKAKEEAGATEKTRLLKEEYGQISLQLQLETQLGVN